MCENSEIVKMQDKIKTLQREVTDLRLEEREARDTLATVARALEALERMSERTDIRNTNSCEIQRDNLECLFLVFGGYIKAQCGVAEMIASERGHATS